MKTTKYFPFKIEIRKFNLTYTKCACLNVMPDEHKTKCVCVHIFLQIKSKKLNIKIIEHPKIKCTYS